MNSKIYKKYAELMWWALQKARAGAGGKYQKGDIIRVVFEEGSIQVAEFLYEILLQAGMIPLMKYSLPPSFEKVYYNTAEGCQLEYIGKWDKALIRGLNGTIGLYSPSSLTHLKNVDPKKMSRAMKAMKPLWNIREAREVSGGFAWTLCYVPTKALAKAANMTKDEYWQEVIKACHLDTEDPIKIWEEIFSEEKEIKAVWIRCQ
jgi:aminopeptidase